MTRQSVIDRLSADVKLDDNVTVRTVVFQSLLWGDYVDCRCFTSDKKVYSALISSDETGDRFISEFVEVPEVNK